MAMPEPAYFLGVDGGGTGCRARIEDATGNVLGQGLSGPATTRLGVEAAWSSIEHAIGAACSEAGIGVPDRSRIAAGIGIAGIGRPGAREALSAIPHGFFRAAFVSDGHAACLGAHGGRDGGIVIAGTGSVGLGFVADKEIRVGGYGFPISDEGSGADLGLRAIRLALRAHDGRSEFSVLLREVMGRFNNDPMEAVAWMDRASATEYARLAPLVMRHADQGDMVGRRIVRAAAEELDAIIRGLIEKGAARVSLIGGLASAIEPWLSPDLRRQLRPAEGDAVSGAILLARRTRV